MLYVGVIYKRTLISNLAENTVDYNKSYIGESSDWETREQKWRQVNNKNYGGKTFEKYNNDGGLAELETSDDVASQTWGGKWQMPTQAMIKELTSQCYWVWTTSYNGKSVRGYIVYKAKTDADKGAKVTSGSSPSSNYDVATDPHIFLPAAGYRRESEPSNAGLNGYYWSRSLDPFYSNSAYYLYFYSGNVWDYYARSRNGGTVKAGAPGHMAGVGQHGGFALGGGADRPAPAKRGAAQGFALLPDGRA